MPWLAFFASAWREGRTQEEAQNEDDEEDDDVQHYNRVGRFKHGEPLIETMETAHVRRLSAA